MPHTRAVPATMAMNAQHDLMATYPITPALPTPRWRPVALLRVLRIWMTSLTKRRAVESRWIRPDLLRWETPTDILARKHTYLYIRSLSGE